MYILFGMQDWTTQTFLGFQPLTVSTVPSWAKNMWYVVANVFWALFLCLDWCCQFFSLAWFLCFVQVSPTFSRIALALILSTFFFLLLLFCHLPPPILLHLLVPVLPMLFLALFLCQCCQLYSEHCACALTQCCQFFSATAPTSFTGNTITEWIG